MVRRRVCPPLACLSILALLVVVLGGCTPPRATSLLASSDDARNASPNASGAAAATPETASATEPPRSPAAATPETAPATEPPRSSAPPSPVREQPRGGELNQPAAAIEAGSAEATAYYVVPTITCPGCAARIKANAKKDPGVRDVAVDLGTKRVTVVYDPSQTDPEKIAEAIRQGGDIVLPGE